MNPALFEELLSRLVDTTQQVIFFPVRHHSPVCSAMLRMLLLDVRPQVVLVEGPSDYNEHLDELRLKHELPIAIYSYFQVGGRYSSGAYYPFCEYSPEWVALQTASEINAEFAFIDLPWFDTAALDRNTHRYADAEMRRGNHVQELCERMQVDDFDELWDRLIEADWEVDADRFMKRVHALCLNIRFREGRVSLADRLREAFMNKKIDEYLTNCDGPIVVVTGGAHSAALAAHLMKIDLGEYEKSSEHEKETGEPMVVEDGANFADEDTEEANSKNNDSESREIVRGIALTSYSYERLDSLSGYDAGMPNPGFYEHAWRSRRSSTSFSHLPLLMELTNQLRELKQTASTADLIAIQTTALGLAAIRARPHVWRSDLVDAVTTSLVKDELQYGGQSAFLRAIQTVLRGNRQGRLAAGSRLPPLVIDIERAFRDVGWAPPRGLMQVNLPLHEELGVRRSRLLHRLRLLGIQGIHLVGETDLLSRETMTELSEVWELKGLPEYESSCIEASRYGTTLLNATTTYLQEQAEQPGQNAATVAMLIFNACRAGIDQMPKTLLQRLSEWIAKESEFVVVSQALTHLAFLYCYDNTFGTKYSSDIGNVLSVSFSRSMWLLESLGKTIVNEALAVSGLRALQEVARSVPDALAEDTATIQQTLLRVHGDPSKNPSIRGASAGMLWNMGAASSSEILAQLRGFAVPDELGDYLNGVFKLAREIVQRDSSIVNTIDQLLMDFSGDGFSQALPPLRLAFSSFTPREKHHLLTTLFKSLGVSVTQPLENLSVRPEIAAEAMALEERLFEAIKKYGLEEVQ
jgi:hypothetical protein